MNKPNNKRSQETDETIIRAAFELLTVQHKAISKITVREICELAGINRSTFYAHYMDVYDLFDKVERHVAQMCTEDMLENLQRGGIQAVMEGLFGFVEGYKEFYAIYFQEVGKMTHMIELMVEPFRDNIAQLHSQDMGYGVKDEMLYHYSFFTAGLSALLAQWVSRGCQEDPHEMFGVLVREYGSNSLFRTWLGASW